MHMNLANLSLTFKADISNANKLNASVVQTGLAVLCMYTEIWPITR